MQIRPSFGMTTQQTNFGSGRRSPHTDRELDIAEDIIKKTDEYRASVQKHKKEAAPSDGTTQTKTGDLKELRKQKGRNKNGTKK